MRQPGDQRLHGSRYSSIGAPHANEAKPTEEYTTRWSGFAGSPACTSGLAPRSVERHQPRAASTPLALSSLTRSTSRKSLAMTCSRWRMRAGEAVRSISGPTLRSMKKRAWPAM